MHGLNRQHLQHNLCWCLKLNVVEMVPKGVATIIYEANLSASLQCSIHFASDVWASHDHQILCGDRTL